MPLTGLEYERHSMPSMIGVGGTGVGGPAGADGGLLLQQVVGVVDEVLLLAAFAGRGRAGIADRECTPTKPEVGTSRQLASRPLRQNAARAARSKQRAAIAAIAAAI